MGEEEVARVRTQEDQDQATRRARRALAGMACLLGVLAVAGCAVGPKYVKPEVPLNPEWAEQGDSLVDTHVSPDSAWWRAFNDPTLDQLIEKAYRQNLPLQVAGLRIFEARAELGIATGRQWPQVQAAFGSATAVGLSDHAANGAGLDREFWDYQIGFDAAWELDFWKKHSSGVKAEEANYLAQLANYDDALVTLTAEVARTYAVIRTFEVLIAQAQANVRIQEEGQRIAESRFRNGATSELDVTQATTLLESTRATIPQLEIGLLQSRNALSTLLGQPTGSVEELLTGATGIPAAPAQAAVGVPAELLRRRPDIRASEFAAMSQIERIGVAKADLYPSFALSGSIGTQSSSGAGFNAGSLFSAGSWFYSFGPRFIWTLFNYGRIKNNVRVQDARFQQTLMNYRDTVFRAAQEVEDGLVGFLKSREATVSAANAAAAAQRSVDVAFVQYREGAVDFQRVLDAQRSLLEEQNTLARTQSSVATNYIALYKALGGGWELRINQPLVSDSTRIEMENRTNWGDAFTHEPSLPESTTSSDE
jgi:NodT family efflux transporter outer membrane factor (OMF) lipoprotein